jgi:hypothetical protein
MTMVSGFSVQVSIARFIGSRFKGSEVRYQKTEAKGQMADENRSVGQPETWHLNPETSEPKTLNPGTDT